MEIKTGKQIDDELVSAQEYGMDDGGILFEEVSCKKWVSVESITKQLNITLENIASAENIPNGAHYMFLKKAISETIKDFHFSNSGEKQ